MRALRIAGWVLESTAETRSRFLHKPQVSIHKEQGTHLPLGTERYMPYEL